MIPTAPATPQPAPLRVLHIASGDRWAGAEVQLYTLLSQLQRRDDTEPHAILMNDGELAHRLRAAGIQVDIVDESRLGASAILRELCALLRQHRPDVVHTHRIKENILGALANRLTVRTASVRTVHGAEEHPPKGLRQLPKHLLRALDRWVGRHWQQRIIAVSPPLAELLAEQFPRDRIVTIENGVDIEAVRAAATAVEFREQEPQAVHIGLVGRLDAVKRVDIFLETARLLCSRDTETDWRFHVFGEGGQRAPLEALTRRLDIDQRVCFHGHRLDIAACIAGLDLLIICSDHEGLPMTLLEALALGVPVVAHAVGGMQVVLDGTLALLLVHQHDPQGYATAVVRVLQQTHSNLSTAARARVAERYSAAGNADVVYQIYADIHGRPSIQKRSLAGNPHIPERSR